MEPSFEHKFFKQRYRFEKRIEEYPSIAETAAPSPTNIIESKFSIQNRLFSSKYGKITFVCKQIQKLFSDNKNNYGLNKLKTCSLRNLIREPADAHCYYRRGIIQIKRPNSSVLVNLKG